jgi:CarD family transcriptional regulator
MHFIHRQSVEIQPKSFGGEMILNIGQKVSYPNHGVCAVENLAVKQVNGSLAEFYSLRLLSNSSIIFVPKANAEMVGIRPIIDSTQCKRVLKFLSEDFAEILNDWKARTRDFISRLQTGDIYETADVLKKLTFLTRLKQLSFREQRLLEKTKFLIVSELAVVCAKPECEIEKKVNKCLNKACEKHSLEKMELASSAAH